MSEEEKDSQDTNSSVSGESNEVQSTGTSSNTTNGNRNYDKRRTNNVRDNRSSNNRVFTQLDKAFKGTTPDIGGVLTLPSEGYIERRVNFSKFQDLLITYAAKNFAESATAEITDCLDCITHMAMNVVFNLRVTRKGTP